MAIRNPQVGDSVHYDGELPEDWDLPSGRNGSVLAVEDDASGDKVVTVLFDSGHEQDILASELDRPAESAQHYDENDEPYV